MSTAGRRQGNILSNCDINLSVYSAGQRAGGSRSGWMLNESEQRDKYSQSFTVTSFKRNRN